MMTPLDLIMTIVFPSALGLSILLCLFPRPALETTGPLVALAYLLGMGLICQWMLMLGMAGQPIQDLQIVMPMTCVAGMAFAAALFRRSRANAESRLFPGRVPVPASVEFSVREFLFLLLMIASVVYVCWRGILVPIMTWDAVSTVAFKAKVIFTERSLRDLPQLPHAAYPLQVPLMEVWAAENAGGWHGQAVKIVFPAMLVSFLVIFYRYLRTFVPRLWGMAGCALLGSSNLVVYHATISYRDLTLMVYHCTALFLLSLSFQKRDQRVLFLAGLTAGFAAFTKYEGLLYLPVDALMLIFILSRDAKTLLRKKCKDFLIFIIPATTVWGLFFFYRLSLKIEVEAKGRFSEWGWLFADRFWIFLKKLFWVLLATDNWGLVWFFLLIALTVSFGRIRQDRVLQFLGLAMVLFFALIAVLAVATESYIWIAGEQMITTLPRLILHFFPLAIASLVLLVSPQRNEVFRTPCGN